MANEVNIFGMPKNKNTEDERAENDDNSNVNSINNGLLIIFNHNKFNVDNKGSRRGSQIDVELLKKAFKRIGFTIVVYLNLTKDQIIETLTENLNKNTYDCVTVVVMTYGELGHLYANDTKYQEVEILECVRENTRADVAKILIFQASRTRTSIPAATYEVPLKNAVVVHSTASGSNSYRSVDHGSYFIVGLCNQLDTLQYRTNLSVNSILECAKRNVQAECDKLNYTQDPQIAYYGENNQVSSIKFAKK